MLDLSAEHLSIVLNILRERVPDAPVFAFGSRVTGTAKKVSDLDTALEGNAPISSEQLALLMEDLVDSDLPIRVDMMDMHTTSSALRDLIAARRVMLA